jgi:hypothetical protein
MVVGVVIGEFVSGVQDAFDTVRLNDVSVRMYLNFILLLSNFIYILSHCCRTPRYDVAYPHKSSV